MSDLAADINRHLRNEAVDAGPPSAIYRSRKFLSRNRAVVVSVGLVVTLLLVGIIGTTWGMVEAARERDRARSLMDFLLDTLALSDPAVALRPNVTVKTLLEHASEKVDAAFGGQLMAEARLRGTIGRAFASMGEDALAEAQLRRAAQILREHGGGDPFEHFSAALPSAHGATPDSRTLIPDATTFNRSRGRAGSRRRRP